MSKIKLLLVEDDESLSFIVKGSLELTGSYEVFVASNGKEGLEAYVSFKPDVIVSDIEMPEMSGEDFVAQIRQGDKKTPILFATAKTSPQDLIRGYQFGIDNYIRKPYLCEELDAHIRGILKRVGENDPVNEVISVNQGTYPLGLYIFHVKHQYLQLGDKHIKLSVRETNILWMLYEEKGKLVRRTDILDKLWGKADFYTSRSLDVFVRNIRSYLKEDPSVEIITERGEGLILRFLPTNADFGTF